MTGSTQNLTWAAGSVTIISGLARMILSFVQPKDEFLRESVYLLVDASVLMGTLAFYLRKRHAAGWIAGLGCGLACVGGLLILGPEPGLLGANNYAAASTALVLGWCILAIVTARHSLSRPAIGWLFVAAAVSGSVPASLGVPGFMIAGVFFGAALVLVGLDLLRPRTGLKA